jgi:SagB-type dehydrogenase family enzyme
MTAMSDLAEDFLPLPLADQDLVWPLFHENSKNGLYQQGPTDAEIRATMQRSHECLPFVGYPAIKLPTPLPLPLALDRALSKRSSSMQFENGPMSLDLVSTLLHFAYGVNRTNEGTAFPRPFRMVPSAGALYPLEVFIHHTHIPSIGLGLYHYNPAEAQIRFLRRRFTAQQISDSVAQPSLVCAEPMLVFLTAIFERSTFKYGDRGYRYALIEAGHVAQNLALVSNALELACLPIGGFRDRVVDELLDLDGITHSTLYMLAIGYPADGKQTNS